ncbi:YggS family pyridoxal phosphate-dependent enzyme [Niabella terrae]
MSVNTSAYHQLQETLTPKQVTLVAVSKLKPPAAIQELYDLGQRDFGENYVQELLDKHGKLPNDIRWHFIGHLQRNKVRFIAPFVHMIHGVDSYNLLREINKQAIKQQRVIDCLLQVHIATEETKFGLDKAELTDLIGGLGELAMVRVCGLMGMASFSEDQGLVRREFRQLKSCFEQLKNYEIPNLQPSVLSMGMSGDYELAMEEGSNLVRIGSMLFGARNQKIQH